MDEHLPVAGPLEPRPEGLRRASAAGRTSRRLLPFAIAAGALAVAAAGYSAGQATTGGRASGPKFGAATVVSANDLTAATPCQIDLRGVTGVSTSVSASTVVTVH